MGPNRMGNAGKLQNRANHTGCTRSLSTEGMNQDTRWVAQECIDIIPLSKTTNSRMRVTRRHGVGRNKPVHRTGKLRATEEALQINNPWDQFADRNRGRSSENPL